MSTPPSPMHINPPANHYEGERDQMQLQHTTRRKPNRGSFRKGADPRRHVFTPEECRDGFYAAMAAIATRNPNATFYNLFDYFTGRRAAQKGVAHHAAA